jgi:WD40 repeat protein
METALSGSWNACLQTLEYHSRPVEAVAFSYDSKLLASASEDYTVKIYDASSGACLQTLEHPNIVTCVAFSRDSFWLATGSCDGLPRIWDVSTGICVKALHGHDEDILSVAFSRFHLASASDDGTIKIWDAIRGVCLRTLQGRDLLITTMAYEENQVASGSNDCTVKIWDDSSGLCVKTLEGHSDSVVSVAFSRNLLASASSDGFIKIWDTSSGSCLHTIDQNKSIRSVTFSHDSNWLASALGDGTISIWETGNWTLLQSTTGHFSSVTSVAFSHDSKLLASGSSDCTVKIWDTSSGNTFTDEAEGYNHDTSALVFSPDSNWLASCSDGGVVEIWDNSGTCLTTICIECRYPISMAFSHDSTHLAVAGSPRDELIQIWDIRSESNGGTCSQTLENVGLVACLAFSPDSTLLANANWDGTIWIRNINSNSQSSPRSLQGRSRDICSIAISYDSTRLVCASLNWSIELWDLDRNVCLQTIDVEETIKNMLFDPTGLYLYTDIGTLSISTMRFTTCIAESGKPQFAELSHDGQWIIYGGKRVLWVPAEYRSYKSRRSLGGRKLAIGMASGKVWICNLDLETSETKM